MRCATGRAILRLATLSTLFHQIEAQPSPDDNATVFDPAVAEGCQCGYYDAGTGSLFTESTITYFNETESLPANDFLTETYVDDYEKGWNTLFREAADPSNVQISNVTNAPNSTTSLVLQVQPFVPKSRNHIIQGASVRTTRRDIKYGSFTSLVRAPGPHAGGGGSTVSMELQFNRTQALAVNLQNTNSPATAYAGMLVNEEWPGPGNSILFSNMTNATWGNRKIDPWDYTEYRVDWTPDSVKFYIGGQLARTILTTDNDALLSVPSPLYLRHWSNGDPAYSAGPPINLTHAEVGWIRMFFNSSLMTDDDHKDFDERCRVRDKCLVSDMTIRGSTESPQQATNVWVQIMQPSPDRKFAIWIAVVCASVTILLLVQPFLKRILEKFKKTSPSDSRTSPEKSPVTRTETHDPILWNSRVATLAQNTPNHQTRAPSLATATLDGDTRANSMSSTPHNRNRLSMRDVNIENSDSKGVPYRISAFSENSPPLPRTASQIGQLGLDPVAFDSLSEGALPSGTPWYARDFTGEECSSFEHTYEHGQEVGSNNFVSAESLADQATASRMSLDKIMPKKRLASDQLTMTSPFNSSSDILKQSSSDGYTSLKTSWPLPDTAEARSLAKRGESEETPANSVEAEELGEVAAGGDASQAMSEAPTNLPELDKKSKDTHLPQAKNRVDYLAGLVAIACLLVTGIHFSLTFVYADINTGAYTHYHSEAVADKTIDFFLLNLVWIGPFLMTSARFLISSYLRSGELSLVAEKTVGRAPRLMIPVASMVLLEYFFINIGTTKWLEYLPSITWSNWPYTVGFSTFGNFVSEVLELIYLIPNAAPLLVFNYCTGVLWTIPVQLQGSWLTLLAVIVIREIRTPWKRFGFYAFCIINHWYALSWGSYFYIGILLTDLDLTYKWRSYLHARPLIYYPFLTIVAAMAVAGLFIDVLSQWTNVSYAALEYAIHPDINSGLSISQAGHAAYPAYFIPRLNGIVFATGLQTALELSPAIQKCFSVKVLVLIFPHIFTIYLFHGFIFWSLGSFLCVHLSVAGLQYWLNILLVAICCYATLAFSLFFLTPVVESVGKIITINIWRDSRDDPLPRQPTLYPFRRDLFLARYETPNGNSKDMTITKIKDPEKVEEHFDPEVAGVDRG